MKVAAILIRGPHDIKADIRETLFLLRLRKKHACAVYERTPVLAGMLRKCKDYITYGEIDEATLAELFKKRGPKKTRAKISDGKAPTSGDKRQATDDRRPQVFHLHPPRGGYGRKGIKVSFQSRGALGYRKDKMSDLIIRMM